MACAGAIGTTRTTQAKTSRKRRRIGPPGPSRPGSRPELRGTLLPDDLGCGKGDGVVVRRLRYVGQSVKDLGTMCPGGQVERDGAGGFETVAERPPQPPECRATSSTSGARWW